MQFPSIVGVDPELPIDMKRISFTVMGHLFMKNYHCSPWIWGDICFIIILLSIEGFCVP